MKNYWMGEVVEDMTREQLVESLILAGNLLQNELARQSRMLEAASKSDPETMMNISSAMV